jgi:hypothetical protein
MLSYRNLSVSTFASGPPAPPENARDAPGEKRHQPENSNLHLLILTLLSWIRQSIPDVMLISFAG